jgi:undecaprenyl diphosphate synthase
MNNIPNHVAIIPDGNRRWAKKRGLVSWEGHRVGADQIEKLSREALKDGIKYLTFWGSSKDNILKRPLAEKRELLKIYEKYFKKLIRDSDIFKNKTKIQIIGDWRNQFPAGLKKILEEGIEKTKHHSNNFLSFMLAYNGDDDILYAVRGIKKRILNEKEDLKITAEFFKNFLLSKDLPAVDLVVRTGVENDPHNSAGFLMWQTQNSQQYFSDKLFPDFGVESLREAMEDFEKRNRRLGR